MAKALPEYLKEDGTLKGVTLNKASGNRGIVISVNLKEPKCITSYTVSDDNFTKAYTKAVDKIAELNGIGLKTKAYQQIADSLRPFLKANNLKLEALDAFRAVPE